MILFLNKEFYEYRIKFLSEKEVVDQEEIERCKRMLKVINDQLR